MTERLAYAEDDSRHHTAHLREMLYTVVDHARQLCGPHPGGAVRASALA